VQVRKYIVNKSLNMEYEYGATVIIIYFIILREGNRPTKRWVQLSSDHIVGLSQ
jgi:hypothetical protein